MATVYKLTAQEKADSGYTHSVKFTHADLTETVADTDQTIELLNAVEGTAVLSCGMKLVTAFEDASDSGAATVAIQLGDGVDPNRYMTSTELCVHGTEILAKVTANAVDSLPYAYVAADTIDVLVDGGATGDILNNIDTGEAWFYFKVVELADLTNG